MIDTSPGRIRVGPKVYPDPRNYGLISMTRVLQKSSQVGVTKIALDLGHEPIWDVFNRFGIGQSPGTGFPGESAGSCKSPAVVSNGEVSLAFGYGISATPLQLASAYSVFANEGKQLRYHCWHWKAKHLRASRSFLGKRRRSFSVCCMR